MQLRMMKTMVKFTETVPDRAFFLSSTSVIELRYLYTSPACLGCFKLVHFTYAQVNSAQDAAGIEGSTSVGSYRKSELLSRVMDCF
jgi:hypothetical protein